jgi:AAA domain
VPDHACYSAGHFAAVRDRFADQDLGRYSIYFIDSITGGGRLCFAWSQQQPEAFTSAGKKDLRGAYGLHAREMIAWLMHIQQAIAVSVIFIGVLETAVDDFNRVEHRLQMEGARTGRELPAIVDEVIIYHWIDFGDAKLTRAFVCTSPNPWQYPAKDRSGRLDQIEEPHLGKLIDKLTKPGSAASISISIADQKASE